MPYNSSNSIVKVDTLKCRLIYSKKKHNQQSNIDSYRKWLSRFPERKFGNFKNLTLVLTNQCNCKCDYCWQFNRKNKKEEMHPDVAMGWIDRFLMDNPNARKITYYGGEPLLCIDSILKCSRFLNEVKNANSSISQHVFTNGLLLNRNLVKSIKSEEIYPIVSIDGDEKVTKLYRWPNKFGERWETLIKGIEYLENENIPYGISCTISDLSLPSSSIVGFLTTNFYPNSIEFSLRHDKEATELWHDESNYSLLWECWDMCIEKGIKVVDLSKRLKPFRDNLPLWNSSSGSKNKIAIMPNGKISPFNGAVSYPELQITYNNKSPQFFESVWNRKIWSEERCGDCEALVICGQGSPFSSWLQFNDFYKPPAGHCSYCRAVLNYIKKRLQKYLSFSYERVVNQEDIKQVFGDKI